MKFIIVLLVIYFVSGNLAMSAPRIPERNLPELVDRSSSNRTARRIDLGNRDADPLNPNEFEEARNLVSDSPLFQDGKDPIEGDHYEGDIIIEEGLTGKNGITSERQMWPGGVVPYTISSSFSSSDRTKIANAINVYHDKTCLKFVPKNSGHSNWVSIVSGSGCSSLVGKSYRNGAQQLSLGRGCVYSGIIQHEMMHAVGFWHEQSRYDRDEYVTINFGNIQPGMEGNFNKVSRDRSQTFGQSYDYSSVMHYGRTAFARNRGTPTITPTKSGVRIGQRDGLSSVDIAKLNAMYKCGNVGPTTIPTRPPPPPSPMECKDQSTSCKGWASKSECDLNPKWMKKYCPVSCRSCEITGTKCQDKNRDCPKWKSNGFCEQSSLSAFMTDNCPKSCGVCKGGC